MCFWGLNQDSLTNGLDLQVVCARRRFAERRKIGIEKESEMKI